MKSLLEETNVLQPPNGNASAAAAHDIPAAAGCKRC